MNSALVRDLVERVAVRTPVVMLDTAWSTDDHRDYALRWNHGRDDASAGAGPKTNLGMQTRVIAGARQFIGTCGGLAWLAPFLGVDTLAVYEDDRYLTAHLYAARYAYRRSAAAQFSTLNISALRDVTAALVRRILGRITNGYSNDSGDGRRGLHRFASRRSPRVAGLRGHRARQSRTAGASERHVAVLRERARPVRPGRRPGSRSCLNRWCWHQMRSSISVRP